MSRRARLLRALARYCARVHPLECTPDGWHPLGPLDRWREARWVLARWDAPGLRYPTRLVRRWRWAWATRGGRRVRL